MKSKLRPPPAVGISSLRLRAPSTRRTLVEDKETSNPHTPGAHLWRDVERARLPERAGATGSIQIRTGQGPPRFPHPGDGCHRALCGPGPEDRCIGPPARRAAATGESIQSIPSWFARQGDDRNHGGDTGGTREDGLAKYSARRFPGMAEVHPSRVFEHQPGRPVPASGRAAAVSAGRCRRVSRVPGRSFRGGVRSLGPTKAAGEPARHNSALLQCRPMYRSHDGRTRDWAQVGGPSQRARLCAVGRHRRIRLAGRP